MGSKSNSFHIYDRTKDYSETNIRDLFDDASKPTEQSEIIGRNSRSAISLIGKAGCGIRYFVTFNLALAYANISINDITFVVALPAMLNQTARRIHVRNLDPDYTDYYELKPFNGTVTFVCPESASKKYDLPDGPFDWPNTYVSFGLLATRCGLLAAIVPAAILARRFGAKLILSVGLLIQSMLQMMIPAAAVSGYRTLQALLMIQGIGMAPLFPCAYMMLANWIPPSERCRMVAILFCGLPFAIMIAEYLGGIICECELCGGWAAHFYFFSACSIMLSMFFVFFMWEDPESCPLISEKEKNYLMSEMSRFRHNAVTEIPWKEISKSKPCWALWLADIGESFYIATAVIVFPFYITTVINNTHELRSLEVVVPELVMVLSGLSFAVLADWILDQGQRNTLAVRKFFNGLALFGTAIGLSVISHTGCDLKAALAIHNFTAFLNGASVAGYRVNYLEISHNAGGIIVAIGKTLAVLFSTSWVYCVEKIVYTERKSLKKWQLCFFTAAIVLTATAAGNIFMASSKRQAWDIAGPDAKSVTFVGAKKSDASADPASKTNE